MSQNHDFMGHLWSSCVFGSIAASICLICGCQTTPTGDVKDARNVPQIEDPALDEGAKRDVETRRWTPDAALESDDDLARSQRDGGAIPGSGLKARTGWTINMATLTMADHAQVATRWIEDFQEVSGMRGAWADSTSRGSIVHYGQYSSPDSAAAQADLKKIKAIQYEGRLPFSRSYLALIRSRTAAGGASPMNLVHARAYLPDQDAVYSLQVGVYEPEKGDRTVDLSDCRKMAENAARQLRAQGELAFFYHGPNRSMVCVGVFGADAVDPDTKLYSPEIMALQERFPNNAFNGRALVETWIPAKGSRAVKRTQSSFLVRVPEH